MREFLQQIMLFLLRWRHPRVTFTTEIEEKRRGTWPQPPDFSRRPESLCPERGHCYFNGVNVVATIPGLWADAPFSQQLFWAIGILGLALIILQAVLTLVIGHHGDINSDNSADGHGGHGFTTYFSLRSISAALLGFGFGGAYLDRIGLALYVAAAGGLGLGLLIGVAYVALLNSLRKLQSDGSMLLLIDAVGRNGKVYLPVPGETAGPGEIQVAFGGKLHNIAAFTKGPTLPVGTFVRVDGLHGEKALLVEKTEQQF